jgi:hypothetical protein
VVFLFFPRETMVWKSSLEIKGYFSEIWSLNSAKLEFSKAELYIYPFLSGGRFEFRTTRSTTPVLLFWRLRSVRKLSWHVRRDSADCQTIVFPYKRAGKNLACMWYRCTLVRDSWHLWNCQKWDSRVAQTPAPVFLNPREMNPREKHAFSWLDILDDVIPSIVTLAVMPPAAPAAC